ncbi:MAG TPA: hypothetical protein PK127_04245 [Clostridiales bacterium]|nr:hypothetical protein [Clostridiales bacterium]HPV01670.1 hypothetical protein [Clostridiales bacterium]
MVEFFITENNEIEIASYDAGTTLADLTAELEAFRKTAPELKTGKCKGCGECCSDNIPVLGLDLALLGIDAAALASDPAALEPGSASAGSDLSKPVSYSGHDAVDFLVLPDKPDMAFRRKAIKEMCGWTSISELEATLLFEYNNAEPLILSRQASGECCFLKDGLCSRYGRRPYSCGLYLCNMGKRLAYIQEMIVRQGTWHAYCKLGWISKADIPHNPFLKADSYDKLLVSDFEYDLRNASEQLFFYF